GCRGAASAQFLHGAINHRQHLGQRRSGHFQANPARQTNGDSCTRRYVNREPFALGLSFPVELGTPITERRVAQMVLGAEYPLRLAALTPAIDVLLPVLEFFLFRHGASL